MTSKAISRVLSIVIVVVIILVVFLGYALGQTSGRISPTTQSGQISTSITSGSYSSQLITYTTVTRTTLAMGGSTYATTTGEYSGCIPPVQCYLTTVTTTVTIVRSDMTVTGGAAGIPCSALQLPCTTSTNMSFYPVELVFFQNRYYYIAHYDVSGEQSVNYTIWFDNSTYYCVSPKVNWASPCPP